MKTICDLTIHFLLFCLLASGCKVSDLISMTLSHCLTHDYLKAENDTLEEESSTRGVEGVLDHEVIYQALPPAPEYRSSAEWDPRGMEHVYLIVNTFLDLILRQDVLPKSESLKFISESSIV